MKNEFKNLVMDLMNISQSEFDKIYSAPSFRGIRINPLKSDFETVSKSFDFKLIKTPFFKDEYYIPADFEGIGNTPLHHAGGFYVQEPSASSVLSVAAENLGENVLDLCAAPGGKSTGVGAMLNGKGILWSNEYVRKRAAVLLSNIERTGIGNAVVSSLDCKYLCDSLEGFFNTVLVDAPCSGEGMWRHNPTVEKQWGNDNINECVNRQREILKDAVKAVKSGGRLIYSTCTFNKRENEETVIWFLENFPQFTLQKIDLDFGMGGLSGNEEIDSKVKRIFPIHGGEGHFIALFKRANDGNCYLGDYVKENISKNHKEITEKFLEENFKNLPKGVLTEKNNLVYLVPENTPLVKGDVLRYGIFVGEIRKNRLEPAHSIFTSGLCVPKNLLNLDINDERVLNFLKGLEIKCREEFSGYAGIAVSGAVLGFGKASKGRITNKYPKGLRLL